MGVQFIEINSERYRRDKNKIFSKSFTQRTNNIQIHFCRFISFGLRLTLLGCEWSDRIIMQSFRFHFFKRNLCALRLSLFHINGALNFFLSLDLVQNFDRSLAQSNALTGHMWQRHNSENKWKNLYSIWAQLNPKSK